MRTLTSGDALGRYELIAPVAKGGMAQVWAARLCGSRGFQKLVAVKTILASALDDPRMEPMFLQEAELAAKVQHPNVAATFELGDEDGLLYLVMEWVHGEPLRYVLHEAGRRGGIPLPIAVNLIGQACLGLQAAHEARDDYGECLGIVHRDVSPHNLLVTYSGTVKVVDFGVAKAGCWESDLTQRGELKGKLAFMSPEQLEGHALDGRSDIFSLGGILYWMIVGRHPFRADTPSKTRSNIRSAVPPPAPSLYCSEYPHELDQAVMKALSFDVEQRWPTARAFREALTKAVPDAFGTDADLRVADYMKTLFGDRGEVRLRQLHQAQQVASSARSEGSLGPVAVSEASTSRGRVPEGTALARWSRVAALAALALGSFGLMLMRDSSSSSSSSSAGGTPHGAALRLQPPARVQPPEVPAVSSPGQGSDPTGSGELPVVEAKALPPADPSPGFAAAGTAGTLETMAAQQAGVVSLESSAAAPDEIASESSAEDEAAASDEVPAQNAAEAKQAAAEPQRARQAVKRRSARRQRARKRKAQRKRAAAKSAAAAPSDPAQPAPTSPSSSVETLEAWDPDTYGGRK